SRAVASDDDDREFVGSDLVVRLIRFHDVAGKLQRVGEVLGVPRVEDHAVLRAVGIEPVVLGVACRLPAANGGGGGLQERERGESEQGSSVHARNHTSVGQVGQGGQVRRVGQVWWRDPSTGQRRQSEGSADRRAA